VLALAVAGLAAAVLALRGLGGDGGGNEAERAPGSAPVATAPGSADASTPPSQPAGADAGVAEPSAVAETIELDLRSTPRARVLVDGRSAGRTPVKVRVPRADEEIEVVFTRRGSRTVRKKLVPDRDHAIDVSLPRARKRPKKTKPQYPF
jgi:hypothetical protein